MKRPNRRQWLKTAGCLTVGVTLPCLPAADCSGGQNEAKPWMLGAPLQASFSELAPLTNAPFEHIGHLISTDGEALSVLYDNFVVGLTETQSSFVNGRAHTLRIPAQQPHTEALWGVVAQVRGAVKLDSGMLATIVVKVDNEVMSQTLQGTGEFQDILLEISAFDRRQSPQTQGKSGDLPFDFVVSTLVMIERGAQAAQGTVWIDSLDLEIMANRPPSRADELDPQTQEHNKQKKVLRGQK